MEKLETENVSLEFQVQSLMKEHENIKLEYQKLFDSIKKTCIQTQGKINELIENVNQKTYAYGDVRAKNRDLLITKVKLKNVEKDTLSMVSKYLNDLEEYLDDGDLMEAKKITVEKRAWDAELDMADSYNYMTEEIVDKLGFVRIDYGDYGRKMVKDVHVEIHGFTFLVDFVMIGYANEGEPSMIFGRDFLVTSKSKVDFGVGEMRIDLTMLEEERDMDALLLGLVENMEGVGSSNGELVKMGKASRNKGHNQKEKIKKVLDKKYKELEEPKPILDVLENYMTYRKKLDEVMMGRAKLSNNEFSEEDKTRIIEHGLPNKMCDLRNFVLPVSVNGMVQMKALADTGASVSVMPFCLYKNLGLSDPRPYHSNLTMADNTHAKSIGDVNNDGNPKYDLVAPSFLDIEDKIEGALAMEAYFNTFENIIVFKNHVDFLGSLSVQLKNTDWGNEGYGMYKRIEGDGAWHAKFKKTTQSSDPNLLIANYKKQNGRCTIEYQLQQVKNANRKWRELLSMERHAYCERLSKLQLKEIGTPRVADWSLFYVYSFDETLKELMKFEYLHSDGDVFSDYSWEELSLLKGMFIRNGLYEESELEHRLFAIHFSRLEIDDKSFNHDAYWLKIGEPTRTNPSTSLIKKPLMRIVHRLIFGSLVHRLAKHLSKHAPGLKENSLICGGHYVAKIAKSLGYLMDEEVAKYSEPIECEKWTEKMLAGELELENYRLLGSTSLPPPQAREQRDSMLMRNNYMLEHSMPILHYLADQANYAYPTYEPPNVTPYPYPYVPNPHTYTHYPDMGNQSHGGGHYEASGDDYFAGSMPSFEGTSIVPSISYEVGGSFGSDKD
ncbi:hypothetical protein Tco_1473683 [Tanacetum coccineum]